MGTAPAAVLLGDGDPAGRPPVTTVEIIGLNAPAPICTASSRADSPAATDLVPPADAR
ncbi:hypothetical protein ACH4Q7_18035 [Streptomyces roseolus]